MSELSVDDHSGFGFSQHFQCTRVVVSIQIYASATLTVVEEHEIYSAIGEDGFRRLIRAFYSQIPQDDILGPIYPAEDFPGAEERLRDFLIFRFGGPARYIENRGHPRLRMRHAPFPVDAAGRDR